MLAAASVFFSGVYWLVKHGAKVINNAIIVGTFPLQQQFKELNNTIKQLNNNFEEQHKSLEELRDEVSRHHDELIEHENRIGNLEGDTK
jgi:predicted  nucleic acid-binding Zn-ribbon protein|nr:MAG TPA: hemolysin [Caudoviricetes sp.]